MGGELVGWKNTLVLLQYGNRFRRYRRLFHKLIGSQAAMKAFLPIEELEARRFLRRVLMKPEDLAAHVRKYVPFCLAQQMKPMFDIGIVEPLVLLFLKYLMDTTLRKTTILLLNWQTEQQSNFPSRPPLVASSLT